MSQLSTVSTCDPKRLEAHGFDAREYVGLHFFTGAGEQGVACHQQFPSLFAPFFRAGLVFLVAGQPRFRLSGGGFQLGELLLQRTQDVRPFFQLATLSVQTFDFRDQGTPIEFLEALEHSQFGETGVAFLCRVPF